MDENAETVETAAVDYIEFTAEIVSAYVSRNSVRPTDMAELIACIHNALTGLGQSSATEAPATEKLTPAQIRKSVTPDAIISFIDGKPYKALKRHLNGNGMTIEQYRERFGLPRDYPSTAANYSAQRSALAKNFGLGQQRKKAAPATEEFEETVSEKPKRPPGRPRKHKTAAEG
ncbi:MucR family transcriptional regulator [Methylobacterium sp. J-088]|uniref:MucR family transcriptional regulator n=1 Tax=unclassified Methylobacterium TaxID=2615210 RepID=UPI001FBBD30B|nr:MucR family transcriptional regulator [Methylobacterium sp. J-088]MCJ2065899.1 MucR family transcriptional regulator [Methylobacterium sp. J-088]